MHTVSGSLPATPPFDFTKTLRFIGMFSPAAGEQRASATSLTKAVALDGRAVAFTAAPAGDVEHPAVTYTLHADDPLTDADRATLEDRIAFYLSLDDDLRPVYAIARADSVFAPIVERLYGLHQVKFLTPFENACWAVLAQRTPMPIARRTKDALVARYGVQIDVDGTIYGAFPEPQRLAAVAPAELQDILRNERKADYLAAVIRFFAETDERWLRTGPYDEVAASIRAIRGIGEWSASFILIRGLGRVERVPASDAEFANAAARVYNGGAPLPKADLQALIDRYSPYAGHWAYYLRNATL
jgi:DNA-3-methyladenine glycosylase II